MIPIIRNILAIVVGVFLGGFVNMGLINLSSALIPLPEGVDPKNIESIKASIHLYQPKHFLFPYLAHALGALSGAIIAGLIATGKKLYYSLGIGGFFLIGGIIASLMIPAPIWFIVLDLLTAYIPMSFIGGTIVLKFLTKKNEAN